MKSLIDRLTKAADSFLDGTDEKNAILEAICELQTRKTDDERAEPSP